MRVDSVLMVLHTHTQRVLRCAAVEGQTSGRSLLYAVDGTGLCDTVCVCVQSHSITVAVSARTRVNVYFVT